ncbi:hypothetical protein PLESTB_000473700 [Pleodorina starrii]|uniref:Uncharacterized protein n=1 Tax=Pleodorina starrii TaxID=330485 RepID=A0A9W6BGP8_9CHLO|nr:hypothetical protein PLESTM_001593000 [Pleodorina starrii]GLC51171.1 hypothetical protein PLESTB_000473700 [Pleodorina starrii]GLC63529.1 hypothetical protein PLESTF_000046200 [Pleodorina starrii]
MATSQLGHRLHGLSTLRRPSLKQANGRGVISGFGRKLCPLVRAVRDCDRPKRDDDKRDAAPPPAPPAWQRAMAGIAAGFCAWSAAALPALADIDPDTNIVAGPSSDALLGAGPDFSFTTLLLFTLLGYWLVKGALYISQNSPDGPDDTPQQDGKQQQQRPGAGSDPTDIGHAHIRSYVDSSQPGPGGEADARQLRNASLARSAAYRVSATLRESQPRIHSLVEQLAAPQPQWPPRPPKNAEVDPVAALVYSRVLQERSAKGPEYVLGPREVAALETQLLEEVAEKVAAEQVAEFVKMAAQGTLHPRGPGGGGGANQHPRSHAHR